MIDGEIIGMTPIGNAHAGKTNQVQPACGAGSCKWCWARECSKPLAPRCV
jgi:hypothetical protein